MKKSNKSIDIDNLSPELVRVLQEIECELGYELIITSGYRSPKHPIEAKKASPGEHTEGNAVDIRVDAVTCFEIVAAALALGISRIGIQRPSGGVGFVHLGISQDRVHHRIWTY